MGRYTIFTMRFLGILVVFVWTAAAQPRYDLVIKGGHVIDAKNGVDGVRTWRLKLDGSRG